MILTETESVALSEMLTIFRSLTQNVAAVASEIKTLNRMIPIIFTSSLVVVAIIAALVK